jgi:hypothetical protein
VLFGLHEAIPAKYRSIASRLKRDFCLFATLGAGYRIHLTRTLVAIAATIIPGALGSPYRSARKTTFGLIGEAFGSKKSLLFGSKWEGFSAIGTLNGFLSIRH